jgi:MFS superfamily sulfate permease-like transporter
MANFLDISELLKVELPGKKVAMGRYDEILWKIRSGYLVVLAGTLGFFVTKESTLKLTPDILIVILWFSLVAWIIDINFRRRQLRVVTAYNELISSAIKNIPETEGPNNVAVELFHISGEKLESSEINQDIPIRKCLIPSIFIYLGTSLVSIWLLIAQTP